MAARDAGRETRHRPEITPVSEHDTADIGAALDALPGPIFADCRSGTGEASLRALSQTESRPLSDMLGRTKAAGYDMSADVRRIAQGHAPARTSRTCTTTSSSSEPARPAFLSRRAASAASPVSMSPSSARRVDQHQPGWTMVGAGIFEAQDTVKAMRSVVPENLTWITTAVATFEPDQDAVLLDAGRVLRYGPLIVCPGRKLDWAEVEGLDLTLGRNEVASNDRYDLAPYTWDLVRGRQADARYSPSRRCRSNAQAPRKRHSTPWETRGSGAICLRTSTFNSVRQRRRGPVRGEGRGPCADGVYRGLRRQSEFLPYSHVGR